MDTRPTRSRRRGVELRRPPSLATDAIFNSRPIWWGVQSGVSGDLQMGDILLVGLVVHGMTRSVVCQTSAGAVVGTLAAFRGLSRLIGCMEQGVEYVAIVEVASFSRCSVRVNRR